MVGGEAGVGVVGGEAGVGVVGGEAGVGVVGGEAGVGVVGGEAGVGVVGGEAGVGVGWGGSTYMSLLYCLLRYHKRKRLSCVHMCISLCCGRRLMISCLLCLESDHGEDECSLAPGQRGSAGSSGKRDGQQHGPQKDRSRLACYSWNEGRCQYPYCRFRHVCVRCQGDHRFTECRQQLSQVPARTW